MLKRTKRRIKGSLGLFIFVICFSLIMSASSLNLFFGHSISADAEDMCEVAVDTVLLMDVSGSMSEGGNPSQCDWEELEQVGPSFQCVSYTETDVTQDWCDAKVQPAQCQPSIFTDTVPSKMESAKTAANSFLDNMGTSDQSALASFSDTASLAKTLSNDHIATQSVINGLVPDGATNIGDAIDAGINELGSVRANPQAVKAMILLTDGKANKPNGSGSGEDPLDVAYAETKAAEAAAQDYKIFTIGLGSDGDINATMLQNIATITSAQYYHAPTQNQLESIYNQIALEVCQYGSISGCKYNDLNNNGAIDDGEPTLPGWDVTLTGGVNGPITQTTDGDGCYVYAGLLAGSYTIVEDDNVSQLPFIFTYPESGQYDITLVGGENVTETDFANYLPVCGNEILDSDYNETCDDGNIEDGDGCSSVCLIEDETPACSNEEDDDDDGLIDADDPGCHSDNDPNNPDSYDPTDTDETDQLPGINPEDIIINEIIQNPSVLDDMYGEWFELFNTTDSDIDINGCVISDLGINTHTIDGSVIVPAGGYAILSRNGDLGLNGGLIVDYVYESGWYLGNSDDEVILTCNDTEIDRVEYDGGPNFPDPTGASMILADPLLDNNVGANWCESTSMFSSGDLGTPGALNDVCGDVSFCGNGEIEGEEICDDGNREDGDGCSSACLIDFGSISGYKLEDIDNNTSTTDDQIGLSGWIINIFNSSSTTTPINTTTTDQTGFFQFLNLTDDTYNLTENLLSYWIQLSQPDNNIVINGNNSQNNNFVNYYEGTLGTACEETSDCDSGQICLDGTCQLPVCGDDVCSSGETCSTCESDCGTCPADGGGGGGGGITQLIIFNEQSINIEEMVATITWQTNLFSTSRVIYSAENESRTFNISNTPNYGYAHSTTEDINLVTFHQMLLTDLIPGTTYYYRVISHASPDTVSQELSFSTSGTPPAPSAPPTPPPPPEEPGDTSGSPTGSTGPINPPVTDETGETGGTEGNEDEEEPSESETELEGQVAGEEESNGQVAGVSEQCPPRPWWLVTLILIDYLLLLIISYFSRENKNNLVWAFVLLLLAMPALVLWFSGGWFWWIWLIVIISYLIVLGFYTILTSNNYWRMSIIITLFLALMLIILKMYIC